MSKRRQIDVLDIHLRAFTEKTREQHTLSSRRWRGRDEPGWLPPAGEREVLIFDTERTADKRQLLTFGFWRLGREILDRRRRFVRLAVREEGILYADDLPERDPGGFQLLRSYAREHAPQLDADRHRVDPPLNAFPRIALQPRAWFVEDRLYKCAYKRKSPVVGLNLTFDLAGVAVGWAVSENGGFTLYTHSYTRTDGREAPDSYRPPIYCQTIDGHRSLISFGPREDPDPGDADEQGRAWRGEFVDLHALLLGLTGEKLSLARGLIVMGCERRKSAAPEHGKITPEYIAYARDDVVDTVELYEYARRELERHPIDVPAHRVFSSASIGKGYLRAMGVRPRLELQPDFDRSVLGAAASSYYGGRVEAPITGSVPVRYLDVLSMYPTVNALLGLWQLVIAGRIEVIDATDEVRELLDRATPENLMRRETWPKLVGIAKLARIDRRSALPELPLRCVYSSGSHNIAINRLSDAHDGWYVLPDLIDSKLRTKRAPRIEQALRFIGVGRQRGLTPVRLHGEVEIDPAQRDFFAAVIEERQRCKQRGDKRRAQALKVIASATSYGIYMETLRDESRSSQLRPLDVHTCAGSFTTASEKPEHARHHCFPPVATLITAGARLMLGLIEQRDRAAGGTVAYMDTDSAAIVATREGGPVPCRGGSQRMPDGRPAVDALSFATVDEIAASLASLNPYDHAAVPGSILELEPESVPPGLSPTGVWRNHCAQLHAFILGPKRYAFYNIAPDGSVRVRRCSEHGLGMRLDPTNPAAPVTAAEDEESEPQTERVARAWIEDLWRYLIERDALHRDVPEPAWFDAPALAKISMTQPDMAKRLGLWPFNFCLVAQVHPLSRRAGEGLRLIAPFELDARKWLRIWWTDAPTLERVRITTVHPDGYTTSDPKAVEVKSYRDVANDLLRKGESKLAQPPGAPRGYRGLHARRTIAPGERVNIGKETHRIEDVEAGLLSAEETLASYAPGELERAAFDRIRPIVLAFPPSLVSAESGASPATIKRLRTHPQRLPSRSVRALLHTWAQRKARAVLRAHGRTPPRDAWALLGAWGQLGGRERTITYRRCPGCERPIADSRRRYHDEGCRKRAWRRRQREQRRVGGLGLAGAPHGVAEVKSARVTPD